MDCRQLECKLVELALDELTQEESAQCRAHVLTCEGCAEALAEYEAVASELVGEPMASPSASESAALASALAKVQLGRAPAPRPVNPLPQGFGEFVAASLAVFGLVTALLVLQIRGAIDFRAILAGVGAFKALGAATVIVIVTSFVPIAITARRRPLNGMTFRR